MMSEVIRLNDKNSEEEDEVFAISDSVSYFSVICFIKHLANTNHPVFTQTVFHLLVGEIFDFCFCSLKYFFYWTLNNKCYSRCKIHASFSSCLYCVYCMTFNEAKLQVKSWLLECFTYTKQNWLKRFQSPIYTHTLFLQNCSWEQTKLYSVECFHIGRYATADYQKYVDTWPKHQYKSLLKKCCYKIGNKKFV